MANYKVNEKSKRITVSGKLTEIEQQIIGVYLSQGFKVSEKTKKRIVEADIKSYLSKNDKKDVIEAFDKKKEAKITDKNGKERKGGYLVALKWFKENHSDLYEAVKKSKK